MVPGQVAPHVQHYPVMTMALDQSLNFDPKADFASRIARIQAGGVHTNRTLFVGNEEALALPRGTFIRKKRKSKMGMVFVMLVMAAAGVMLVTMSSVNLL